MTTGKDKADGSESNEAKKASATEVPGEKENRVNWLLKISQIAANLTIIASLAVATMTYVQQAEYSKKVAANQLLAQFHSDRIYDAREILHKLWSRQDFSLLEAGIPRQTINILIDKTIVARKMDLGIVNSSIVRVTQFLDEVAICRREAACDTETVDNRLGSYGRNFYCLYQSRIEAQGNRRLLPEFGQKLAEWIEELGGCRSK